MTDEIINLTTEDGKQKWLDIMVEEGYSREKAEFIWESKPRGVTLVKASRVREIAQSTAIVGKMLGLENYKTVVFKEVKLA